MCMRARGCVLKLLLYGTILPSQFFGLIALRYMILLVYGSMICNPGTRVSIRFKTIFNDDDLYLHIIRRQLCTSCFPSTQSVIRRCATSAAAPLPCNADRSTKAPALVSDCRWQHACLPIKYYSASPANLNNT